MGADREDRDDEHQSGDDQSDEHGAPCRLGSELQDQHDHGGAEAGDDRCDPGPLGDLGDVSFQLLQRLGGELALVVQGFDRLLAEAVDLLVRVDVRALLDGIEAVIEDLDDVREVLELEHGALGQVELVLHRVLEGFARLDDVVDVDQLDVTHAVLGVGIAHGDDRLVGGQEDRVDLPGADGRFGIRLGLVRRLGSGRGGLRGSATTGGTLGVVGVGHDG